MNQKGFTPIVLVIVLALFLLIGGAYYYKTTNTPASSNTTTYSPSPSSSLSPSSTADWKTYIDPKYKFSFVYPPTWTIGQLNPDYPGGERLEITIGDQKNYNINRSLSLILTDTLFSEKDLPYTTTGFTEETYGRLTGKLYSAVLADPRSGEFKRYDFISSVQGKTYWFIFTTDTQDEESFFLIFQQLLALFNPPPL